MDQQALDKLLRLARERQEPGTPSQLARRMVCHLAEIEDPETPVGVIELHVACVAVDAIDLAGEQPSDRGWEACWEAVLCHVSHLATAALRGRDLVAPAKNLAAIALVWLDKLPGVRRCRVCGCTDDCACAVDCADGVYCHWLDEDLCSECVGAADGD